MAYKQALAFAATGDVEHAETAQRIMEGWAAVNKVWGLQYENGPLGERRHTLERTDLGCWCVALLCALVLRTSLLQIECMYLSTRLFQRRAAHCCLCTRQVESSATYTTGQ
jgi:hypothetical protein